MSRNRTTQRSRARKAGESAFGALLLARLTLLGLLALFLVIAGVWASLDTARQVMASSAERGTMTLRDCTADACTGPFVPSQNDGGHRDAVTLAQTIAREEGEELTVAVLPDTDEALRAGAPGVLYAWLPLTGALLLASLVIAGGLRMFRTAWATGGAGLCLLAATFLLW